MFIVFLGYCLGVCLVYSAHPVLLAGCVLAPVGIVACRLYCGYWVKPWLCFVFSLALVFGCIRASTTSTQWLHQVQYVRSLTHSVAWQGQVATLPRMHHGAIRFIFKARVPHRAQTISVSVGWYGQHPSVHAGEWWQLRLKLKPPHGLQNKTGFHELPWLLASEIAATAYVKKSADNHRLQKPANRVLAWRAHTIVWIDSILPKGATRAFIVALWVGSRDEFAAKDWLVLQNTATVHLVAIAGLHLGFIFWVVRCFAVFVCQWIPRLALWVPVPKLAALLATCGAFFYALGAGFELPAQRALWMMVFGVFFYLKDHPLSLWNVMTLAACMLLFLNPWVILTMGFWMSFAAVFWIVCAIEPKDLLYSAHQKKAPWRRHLKQVFWVHLYLWLGLTPLILFNFGQSACYGLVANAIAIPWVGFVVLPLCIVANVLHFFNSPGAVWVVHLAAHCLWPLWQVLASISHWPGGTWHIGLFTIPSVVFLSLAVFYALLPRGVPFRGWAVFFVLPALFAHPATLPKGAVQMTVLDVGQGLAIVVRTKKHVLIYDTGPHYFQGFDAGQAVVLPFLQYLGIKSRARMVVSHADNDHSGGALSVLHGKAVDEILSSVPKDRQKAIFGDQTSKVKPCVSGQHWRWDGVQFTMISPEVGQVYQGNNSSCVLKVTAYGKSLLLTGDIEKKVEKKLVQEKKPVQAEVLVAPHHGSNTSSTQLFIRAVRPKYVLMSAGYKNRFHFPSSSVLARYHAAHVKVYNTAYQGAIEVTINKKGTVITTAGLHNFLQEVP